MHTRAGLLADNPHYGKRWRLDDDHLGVVAEVYLEAGAAGDMPVKAVAEAFGTSPANAAKWVIKARQRGLIPPTTPGASPIDRSSNHCPSCGAFRCHWRTDPGQ